MAGGMSGADCIGCGACTAHCPAHIPIPEHLALLAIADERRRSERYAELTRAAPGIDACIGCHSCERHCPQGIRIISALDDIARSGRQPTR